MLSLAPLLLLLLLGPSLSFFGPSPLKPPPTAVSLPSGLAYVDTSPGQGKSPSERDFISVHYKGKLASNGKVFDSSRPKVDTRSAAFKGDPLEFPLGRGKVIKGWEQGIKGMKVGGERRLFVPAALAYGAEGTPDGVIPGNADLVFDVELVSINGSMDTAKTLFDGFRIAFGLIVVNGLFAAATGHELREYVNDFVNR
ncbi:hypothetical protein TeGR_g8256 [Tetraparma gracilis]|uniref:peptidylprolyl isomerase n=1 Tax=Tetraparma gracilis TaxID=2962635 RepID=A0ABQ6N795_9STRA|nr:hypothetical protein TeGR_g8256 [Tetraparma gracilis]